MQLLNSLFGKKREASPDEGNPALVRAMEQVAANDNPEARRRLYEALLGSILLVPVPEIPKEMKPGQHVLDAKVQVQLRVITDNNGARVAPAFTDAEAVRNFDPNTPFIGLKGIDLFRTLVGGEPLDVLINPFDPIRKMIRPGGRVTRGEIERLAKGVAPASLGHQQFRIEKGEEVFVGMPANPPSEAVLDLLRGTASTFPAIGELYFFQMARGQGPSTTVIGILLAKNVGESQQREIAQALGKAIQTEMKPDQFLDFMFLGGPFGEHVRKIGRMFFHNM